MRKLLLLPAIALCASLLPVQSATAVPPTGDDGLSGRITFRPHTHSSQFGAPSGADTLFATEPVPVPITEGDFSYSSISCEDPAPFNDVSLDFSPDYPGLTEPASTRSLIELTVTDAEEGTVEGTITTIVCETGERIFFSFEGEFIRISDNNAPFRGTFQITGGTGSFSDLKGSGTFRGNLTCLQPILEQQDASSCADLGFFSDAVMTLRGAFSDPTA